MSSDRFFRNWGGVPGLTLNIGTSLNQGTTPVLYLLNVGEKLLLMWVFNGRAVTLMDGLEWKDRFST